MPPAGPGIPGARPVSPRPAVRARVRFACAAREAVTSGPLLAAGGAVVARSGLGGADRRWATGAAAAAGSAARQPASLTAALPPAYPSGAMAGSSSLEAVRRKIRSLQEQADAAEERAGSLQRELDHERKLRETVRDPPITLQPPEAGASSPGGPARPSWRPQPRPHASRAHLAHLAHLGLLAAGSGEGPGLFSLAFPFPFAGLQ